MKMKLDTASHTQMNDLIAAAVGIKNRSRDIILEDGLSKADFETTGAYGKLNFLAPLPGNNDGMTCSFRVGAGLSQWALGQACSLAGISHLYMGNLMKAEQSDVKALAAINMNTLMPYVTKPLMFRLYQPEQGMKLSIRGIVSAKYAVFDSLSVLETVHEVLGDNFNIKGHYLDETDLHLRVTRPEPLEVNGEDLYPGLIISSGDVGNRSLTVQFFLWKQVCTNGLVLARVSGKVLHKRHLGIYDSADFKASLVDALESFPAFCAQAKELVDAARKHELDDEGLKARLAAFGKSVKLSEEENDTLKNLTVHYGMTLWGFANALTEFAQAERFDLDNRMDIEAYAGEMLTARTAA